jgi:hypothetical protein
MIHRSSARRCSTCLRGAEFESELIKMRTQEGMKVARAKGRLRGKQPKLKPNRAKHLLELHDSGNYTQAELAELGRSTIYRTIDRMRPQLVEPQRPFTLVPPSPNTQISTRGNLVQPSNATVSRYGQYAESNQEARTFSRASSLPPSQAADSCHATFLPRAKQRNGSGGERSKRSVGRKPPAYGAIRRRGVGPKRCAGDSLGPHGLTSAAR